MSFHSSTNNSKLLKPNKTHYSIRRGPGQISHLLMPQRIDLILLNSASIAKKHEFKSHINNSNSLNQIDNVVVSDNNNNNKKNSLKCNSLMFDIKLFIDDESQQDDGFNYDNNNNNSNDATTSNQVQKYIKVKNNGDEIK